MPALAVTERKVRFGFAFALACMALIGVVSYLSVARLLQHAQDVGHAYEVLGSLELLLAATTDSETAERGYVITGDDSYLEPYRQAGAVIDGQTTHLRGLTGENLTQRRRLDSVAALVADRLQNLRTVMELRKNQGFAAAQREILTGKGKLFHDQIRSAIVQMENTETAVLEERERQTHTSAVLARAVIIGGGILACGFVGLALFAIRRDFAGRTQAERALRDANENLELRVRERTAHLAREISKLEEAKVPAQKAYDDLPPTQRMVMQQERLLALGQMASGIAHAINNAISPVTLYIDALLESEPGLSVRGRGQLEIVQRAVDDVARTVARMREFYRAREPQLMQQPVNLNSLAQQVVDLTRARWSDMAQQRGIVIEARTDLAADLPQIMGADNELREALINLIFNAVDAMPLGGPLTLRTRVVREGSSAADDSSEGRFVQIEVIDAGIGMNDETRRRCLEPFFSTKGERGTGLGLAMVYGTAQRHSADIEIESAVGKGTIMRMSFAIPS